MREPAIPGSDTLLRDPDSQVTLRRVVRVATRVATELVDELCEGIDTVVPPDVTGMKLDVRDTQQALDLKESESVAISPLVPQPRGGLTLRRIPRLRDAAELNGQRLELGCPVRPVLNAARSIAFPLPSFDVRKHRLDGGGESAELVGVPHPVEHEWDRGVVMATGDGRREALDSTL